MTKTFTSHNGLLPSDLNINIHGQPDRTDMAVCREATMDVESLSANDFWFKDVFIDGIMNPIVLSLLIKHIAKAARTVSIYSEKDGRNILIIDNSKRSK